MGAPSRSHTATARVSATGGRRRSPLQRPPWPRTGPRARLDTLVELRCEHIRQHGRQPSEREERLWLGPLLTELGDRVTVFAADAGSTLRGFSLFVDDGVHWNAFAVARCNPDLYFELTYHTHRARRSALPRYRSSYSSSVNDLPAR
jgi:hypothetical protein